MAKFKLGDYVGCLAYKGVVSCIRGYYSSEIVEFKTREGRTICLPSNIVSTISCEEYCL